jgi:hypothetical protein
MTILTGETGQRSTRSANIDLDNLDYPRNFALGVTIPLRAVWYVPILLKVGNYRIRANMYVVYFFLRPAGSF